MVKVDLSRWSLRVKDLVTAEKFDGFLLERTAQVYHRILLS
jgi:hypothetical protein